MIGRKEEIMEFFASTALIVFVVWLCKKDEWKANNRTTPPRKQIDYSAMQNDRILKGMSNRGIAIKKNQGGYDVPVKQYETWDEWKAKRPWGNWN